MLDFNEIQSLDSSTAAAGVFRYTMLKDLWVKFVDKLHAEYNEQYYANQKMIAHIIYHDSKTFPDMIDIHEFMLTSVPRHIMKEIFKNMWIFYPILNIQKIVITYTDLTNLQAYKKYLPKYVDILVIQDCLIYDAKYLPKTSSLTFGVCNALKTIHIDKDVKSLTLYTCGAVNFDEKDSLPNIETLNISRCLKCDTLPKLGKNCTLTIEHQGFPKNAKGQSIKEAFILEYNDLVNCPDAKTLHIVNRDTTFFSYKYTTFYGISDSVERLYVNQTDPLDFPIEETLPKKLEYLYLDGYYMRDKGYYDPTLYHWPSSMKEIEFGPNTSQKYRKILKNIFENTNVKIH